GRRDGGARRRPRARARLARRGARLAQPAGTAYHCRAQAAGRAAHAREPRPGARPLQGAHPPARGAGADQVAQAAGEYDRRGGGDADERLTERGPVARAPRGSFHRELGPADRRRLDVVLVEGLRAAVEIEVDPELVLVVWRGRAVGRDEAALARGRDGAEADLATREA